MPPSSLSAAAVAAGAAGAAVRRPRILGRAALRLAPATTARVAAFSSASSASSASTPSASARRPSCARPLGPTSAHLTVVAAAAARRTYHSFDRPNEPSPRDTFSTAEQAILEAAYRHIADAGFTDRTLALGAHDAGYPAISTAILPDGVFSLVRWHLVSQRTALAARCEALFGPSPTDLDADAKPRSPAEVADRAEQLIWERLLGNREVVGRWQEALAIMAQPSYVPASLRELALLADEIWALAGDTAVDPSWYTKRAAVSAIYASCELFMTTDKSGPDFPATRAFLKRRFAESRDLGGYVRSLTEWASFTASAGVNVLRSKGINI